MILRDDYYNRAARAKQDHLDRAFGHRRRPEAWRVLLILAVATAVCVAALVGFASRADAYHPTVSTNTYCGHETRTTSWTYTGAINTRIVHAYSVTYGGAHVHVYRLQRAEYGGWWSGTKWVTYSTVSRAC